MRSLQSWGVLPSSQTLKADVRAPVLRPRLLPEASCLCPSTETLPGCELALAFDPPSLDGCRHGNPILPLSTSWWPWKPRQEEQGTFPAPTTSG